MPMAIGYRTKQCNPRCAEGHLITTQIFQNQKKKKNKPTNLPIHHKFTNMNTFEIALLSIQRKKVKKICKNIKYDSIIFKDLTILI